MQELYSSTDKPEGLNEKTIHTMLDKLIEEMKGAKNILLVPPDFTRCYSYAGPITEYLYLGLSKFASVSVIPALGTHAAMTVKERTEMFGTHIPDSAFIIHDWRKDVVTIGEVPSSVVSEISNGKYAEKIEVEVNHNLVDQTYDQIISIGQIVPHEIVGLANYTKNLLVGLGGRDMINKSHFIGALCNMEKALGVRDTPARQVFDYAQKNFLDKLPLTFVFTVTTFVEETLTVHGVFIGKSRKAFEEAAQLSQKYNIVHVERRAKKVVTYLDPEEMKTTWIGNKGIYRTRMLIADGGTLMVLAPGVKGFGENEEIDQLTRKYGYCGTPKLLELYKQGCFDNETMEAAHIIHGSSEGRFTICYCTKPELLSKEEINQVNYDWMNYYEAVKQYNPETMKEGWNIMPDGEEIYFVRTPAVGLWKVDENEEN